MFVDVSKFKKVLAYAASVFFAVLSVTGVIYYIICPSEAFFHADCSDTILWAQASYDSGTLFNPDFGYAAMLPFGGTMLMVPFIGIFGVSMTTHHIGMVLFTALLFASVLFLCRSLKFSYPLSLTALGIFASVLCSSAKLREIFYEHVIYYSICVFIICVMLALFLRFKESFDEGKTAKLIIVTFATVIFTACASLDGMQVIATGIVPVLMAAVIEVFFDKEKLLVKKNRSSVYFCIIGGVSVIIGMFLLSVLDNGVSAGYAGAYSSYSNMNEWLTNLQKFPEHWFSLFGVDAHYGMSLFSPESIVNMVRIAVAVIIVAVPFVALIFYNKFDFGSKILILTHFSMTAVIMFGYIFGILSAVNWRLSPILCTGIIVCIAAFRCAKDYIVPKRIAAVIMCVLVLMSAISFKTVAEMDKNGIVNNEKYNVIQYLKENGLNYGYATFWNSQVITVLSDSEVRAANVDVNENGIAPCPYQANRNWFKPQEGVDRYFVLLSDAEVNTLMSTDDWAYFESSDAERLVTDGYVIYVFNSTDFLN